MPESCVQMNAQILLTVLKKKKKRERERIERSKFYFPSVAFWTCKQSAFTHTAANFSHGLSHALAVFFLTVIKLTWTFQSSVGFLQKIK